MRHIYPKFFARNRPMIYAYGGVRAFRVSREEARKIGNEFAISVPLSESAEFLYFNVSHGKDKSPHFGHELTIFTDEASAIEYAKTFVPSDFMPDPYEPKAILSCK